MHHRLPPGTRISCADLLEHVVVQHRGHQQLLSRSFSCFSWCRRWVSYTSSPPYLDFHVQKVAELIP